MTLRTKRSWSALWAALLIVVVVSTGCGGFTVLLGGGRPHGGYYYGFSRTFGEQVVPNLLSGLSGGQNVGVACLARGLRLGSCQPGEAFTKSAGEPYYDDFYYDYGGYSYYDSYWYYDDYWYDYDDYYFVDYIDGWYDGCYYCKSSDDFDATSLDEPARWDAEWGPWERFVTARVDFLVAEQARGNSEP